MNWKTIYINFKLLPIKHAVKLPIYVTSRLVAKDLHRGCIILNSKEVNRGMIHLGAEGSFGIEPKSNSYLKISKGSKLIFKGRATICEGFTIRCENNSILTIGDNFYANSNFELFTDFNVTIQDDVLVGWNVHVRNGNGHKVFYENVPTRKLPDIVIGKHVWLCANTTILAGTHIADNSVVGIHSVVSQSFETPNVLICGFPASVIKGGISWER